MSEEDKIISDTPQNTPAVESPVQPEPQPELAIEQTQQPMPQQEPIYQATPQPMPVQPQAQPAPRPITVPRQKPAAKHTPMDFLLNVLSAAAGYVLGSIIMGILGIVLLIYLLAAGTSYTTSRHSVLYIPLQGVMQEKKTDKLLDELLSDELTIGLDEVLQAISEAKDNDNIDGIYLQAGALASDPASLEEIRKALLDFKKSGKFIVSYGDTYTQGVYYLCSVADIIALNPSGQVDWHGLNAETMYYTDLLAKVGVKMQVFKVGTYKSAVEPYIQTQMSEANREQTAAFLNDIWSHFVQDVSKSRDITTDSLNTLADNFTLLATADDIKRHNLVDRLLYKDEFINLLKKKVGISQDDDVKLVTPSSLALTGKPLCEPSGKTIAVCYADGEIVNVEEATLLSDNVIDATTLGRTLKTLEKEDDVKAVVLRINSPGGSAFASEQLWHYIKQLSAKKKVIVSMGGYAASGGYYMAVGADYIFAEPTTLTGSIGIFGMVPDASDLLTNKLGLKFDNVKTNQMADFGSLSRPFNDKETALMQTYITNGYNLFLKRVAEGRKMTTSQVDSIGQGRVWTGTQALRNGLVDQLGSLQDAIDYAAAKAGLKGDYFVKHYPEDNGLDSFLDMHGADLRVYQSQMRHTLGSLYEPAMTLQRLQHQDHLQARLPYYVEIK